MRLPDGYILRHPQPDEALPIQAILDAAETADTGEPRRHDYDIATEWSSPRCRPADDWWVVEAPGAEIAAVGWIWPETAGDLTADHYVHPDHRGRGLGGIMLDIVEQRAAELAGEDGRLRRLTAWAEDFDSERRASLVRRGYVAIRQYFEMAIALDADLPDPSWPDGIVARGFRPGRDDEALYEADQEAFVEHHLYERRDYDEWRLFFTDARDADVTLWWLAWDGDDLAGFVTSYAGDRGAVVDDLAVRKPWRGRGIGQALLFAAFSTLRGRGQTIVRLYVDAQNVTNAVRVYESAGMHVSRRFDVMEKPLA
jgi:mycothiol synthase